MIVIPRPRLCRKRLSSLMLLLVGGALLFTTINYLISSDQEDFGNDILDPRYLSKQMAYKKKLIDKFHLDTGGNEYTQTCKIPSLSLKTDVNQFAFHELPPLECGAEDMFVFENYEIRLNKTVVGKRNITQCVFKSIEWETDSSFTYSDAVERKTPGPFEMKVKNEFFYVECQFGDKPGQSEEIDSNQMEEMVSMAAARRLLQNQDIGRRQPASDTQINRVVQRQNLNDKPVNEIVKNIQNIYQSTGRGGILPLQGNNPPNLPPDGHQQAGGERIPRGESWRYAPRYMGSMGLPDSPLIDSHAQHIHQVRKETGHKPLGGFPSDGQNNLPNHNSENKSQNRQPGGSNALPNVNVPQNQGGDSNAQQKVQLSGQNLDQNLGFVSGRTTEKAIDAKLPDWNQKEERLQKPQVSFQKNDNIQSKDVNSPAIQVLPNGDAKYQPLQNSLNRTIEKQNQDSSVPFVPKQNAFSKEGPTERKSVNNTEAKEQLDKTDDDQFGNKEASIDTEVPYEIQGPDKLGSVDMYRYGYESPETYEQFFAQVIPKLDIINRSRSINLLPDRPQRMNVLIFAMDSMSHLTYQRKMPKTYHHIQSEMDSVVLNGYNIVGDATTAAIIPLTTGRTEMELPEVRKNEPGSTFVDSYPLIWNKYEQAGYVTLFTEDKPDISVFNLRLNGFEEIPVDHYMRPFYQAVLASYLKQNSASYCTGGKPSHKYMLRYLKDFFHRYPVDIPKFAFAFLNDLSHDDNNPAQYADEDLVSFFKWMKSEGHLANTVVIVMGDHGARYSSVRKTTQGKLEERLPMMSLAFPRWFHRKYPEAIRNLRENADRLTTPFDVHATLKSILDPRTLTKPVLAKQRGISLLKAHPLNRTCASAGIDMHWCTCMNWQEVDPTHERVVTATTEIVNRINKFVERHDKICAKLKLSRIYDAKIGLPNNKVLKYMKSADDSQRVANFTKEVKSDVFYMQIIAETVPGRGLFEGTVIISEGGTVYSVMPEISRINMYGDQAHCVADDFPDLRKYCYCRMPKPTSATNIKHGSKQSIRRVEQRRTL